MQDDDAETPPGAGRSGRILGAVLAGGLSSRMGREKALLGLDGRPLLAHVLDRLAPQVDAVVLNANGDPARFAAFALPVIPDSPAPSGIPPCEATGPLAGIAASLRWAARHGFAMLATCPSDAPFLPRDAVRRLAGAIGPEGAACLSTGRGLEPLVAIWRVDALAAVEAALSVGDFAVRAALARAGFAVLPPQDWGPDESLSNLNTPEDLALARAESAGRTQGPA